MRSTCKKSGRVLVLVLLFALTGCAETSKSGGIGKNKNETSSAPTNLKKIAEAMLKYHEKLRHFPAADSAGEKNQKQGLSWRVHLLPELGYGELYQRFRLDEPWDSPHNKQLISEMPSEYKCQGSVEKGKTSVHVFTGERAPFAVPGLGPRLRDFHDGSSQTALVVIAGSDRADYWTKPGGLPYDSNADPIALLGKIPENGFLAVNVVGGVFRVPPSLGKRYLHAIIQPKDGIVIPEEVWTQLFQNK